MNPDRFEGVLFTPPGKTTIIQNKDFPVICEYLKPGDRIAWHRPYMLIHEATVIHVSQCSGKILVAEVHKDFPLHVVGKLKIVEIKLGSQYFEGKLYRYDYDRELTEDEKIIRELVSQLGNDFGYSILAKNCQHLTERTHTGGQGSYQTRWFFLSKVLIEPLFKPFFAELFEYLYDAKNESIGLVGTVVLHVATFLTKFVVAYRKLKGGRITWVHFTTLIFKEIAMSLGDIVLQYLAYRFKITSPTFSYFEFLHVSVAVVLAFMGACILDALLLWSGLVSSESSWRYVIHGVGAAIGLGLGLGSTGWFLEFLFSAVLGFTAQLVAHGLYHAGSWLYSRLKGEEVDSRLVNDIKELKRGDHITNYEHCFHPSCHAIIVSVVGQQQMRVIKNTYSEGVVEREVPFRKGNVYKYLYHRSECRPDSEVLEIARSKIGGPNTYSWFTNNCKSFAKHCKCGGNGNGGPSGVNTALEGVNVTSIIDDLLANEGLSEDRRKIYTSLKLSIIECP